MNLAAKKLRALSVEITDTIRVPSFIYRNANVRRKTDSRKHSQILAARLGIAACASCFPVWTNGEECFLLRYSVQSSESKRLLAHRGV